MTTGDERLVLEALELWAAAASLHRQSNAADAHGLILGALERLGELKRESPGVDREGLRDALVLSLEALRDTWTPASHRWPEPPAEEESGVELEHRARCPYCGEPVLIAVAAEDAQAAQYVEDCPVCCRPWEVSVRQGAVTLRRGDSSGA